MKFSSALMVTLAVVPALALPGRSIGSKGIQSLDSRLFMAGRKVTEKCGSDSDAELWHASMTSDLQKPVQDATHLNHIEATFVCNEAAYKVIENPGANPGAKGELEVVKMPGSGPIVGGRFFELPMTIKIEDAENALRKKFQIEGNVASLELKWITTRYTASEPHYFFQFVEGPVRSIGAMTGKIVGDD